MKPLLRALISGSGLFGAVCTAAPPPAVSSRTTAAVSTSRVAMTDVATTFEAGGVVRARATALIASRVLAPITQVHVRAGDRVRSGARLVTLDGRDFQSNRAQAEAARISSVEVARAAEADARAAESAVVLARVTHDRLASLRAKRSATDQELDQAVAALAAAEAQRSSAHARLAAANAARDSAEAAANTATISVSYAALTAPFDGLVTDRRADPGTMATPGVPLLTLEDPSGYRLEVQVEEARASLVTPGERALVRLDNASAGNDWIPGRVAEIARIDAGSHSFLLKIDLPQIASLRSGLFGRVRFVGPSVPALTVPASSLIRRGQLTFVYVVDGDNLARLRPIAAGSADHDRVEVLAGVREGDVVVTSPGPALEDGAQVTGVRR